MLDCGELSFGLGDSLHAGTEVSGSERGGDSLQHGIDTMRAGGHFLFKSLPGRRPFSLVLSVQPVSPGDRSW